MPTLTNAIPNHRLIGKFLFDYEKNRCAGIVEEVVNMPGGVYVKVTYMCDGYQECDYITVEVADPRYSFKP